MPNYLKRAFCATCRNKIVLLQKDAPGHPGWVDSNAVWEHEQDEDKADHDALWDTSRGWKDL